jgi:hypothetical protein
VFFGHGHRTWPLTALAFSAWGAALRVGSSTAKSGYALQLCALKWPCLALWPLAVAPGMPFQPHNARPKSTLGKQDIDPHDLLSDGGLHLLVS